MLIDGKEIPDLDAIAVLSEQNAELRKEIEDLKTRNKNQEKLLWGMERTIGDQNTAIGELIAKIKNLEKERDH